MTTRPTRRVLPPDAEIVRVLRESEAAALLSVSERTLRHERQAGRLPYIMIRGAIRYALTDLQAYIEEARQCHSTDAKVRHSGNTTSRSTVCDFEAALAKRESGKRKR